MSQSVCLGKVCSSIGILVVREQPCVSYTLGGGQNKDIITDILHDHQTIKIVLFNEILLLSIHIFNY